MRSLLLFIFVIGLAFHGCSPYQKAVKSEDPALKFQYADSMYSIGKYKKGLRLMEQIVPAYRGKPQGEKLMFIYADTYYQLGDSYLSGYHFERFVSSYPNSEKVEEAAFKGAKSYYRLSPLYSLDQADTNIALDKLQDFINTYPESGYIAEANELVVELAEKLEKKRFEVAKQYHHREEYKAAIKTYENFILDFPGSKYREEVYYQRLKAAHELAVKSVDYLVEERLLEAKKYYNSFNRYFSDSQRKADADKILSKINEELEARAAISSAPAP